MREADPRIGLGIRHHSYSSERVLDSVVLESEIQGLDGRPPLFRFRIWLADSSTSLGSACDSGILVQ